MPVLKKNLSRITSSTFQRENEEIMAKEMICEKEEQKKLSDIEQIFSQIQTEHRVSTLEYHHLTIVVDQ